MEEIETMRSFTFSNYSLVLSLVLNPQNGRVDMAIHRINRSGGGDDARLFPREILMYLEVQCPWIKRR